MVKIDYQLIVTGSLSFDYIFDLKEKFSDYILPDKIHQINFSFVSETHKKTFGGTAGNQCFYLARLNLNPYLCASAGFDFKEYKAFLENNLVKTNLVHISKKLPTATGFVITDRKDNQIWMFSKGAMKEAKNIKIPTTKLKKSFLLIAPDEPKAIINYVNQAVKNNISFAFDPAFYIPSLPIKTLIKGIQEAKIIFGNDYEISFLEKRTQLNITKNLKKNQVLVKTLSNKGSEIYSQNKKIKVGIFKTKKVVDPTGAGDAYRAGFIYGFLNHQPLKTCAKMAASTASFAVETKGTMNEKFNKKDFEKRIKMI